MVVMTENSMGRSIRQTWRALRHERLMPRPARRDRRVQLEACDQGVSQQRDLVRPHSMVLYRLNILADISNRESKGLSCLPHLLFLDPIVVQTNCRSEGHKFELPTIMRISYSVFRFLKKKQYYK